MQPPAHRRRRHLNMFSPNLRASPRARTPRPRRAMPCRRMPCRRMPRRCMMRRARPTLRLAAPARSRRLPLMARTRTRALRVPNRDRRAQHSSRNPSGSPASSARWGDHPSPTEPETSRHHYHPHSTLRRRERLCIRTYVLSEPPLVRRPAPNTKPTPSHGWASQFFGNSPARLLTSGETTG
jgi:hypothetical protein